MRAGAFGYLEKPVDRDALMEALSKTKEFIDRPVKNLLLVEDDDGQRLSDRRAPRRRATSDVTSVGTAEAALEAIQARALRLRRSSISACRTCPAPS